MNEAEFERLLDAVRAAIVTAPEELPYALLVSELPRGANDNAPPWSLTPRPEDWHAAT